MHSRPLQVTSPAPREVWERLLRSSEDAMAFHTPGWLDCLCAAGGYADASRFYELPGDRQLVLPLVRPRRLPETLTAAASLPYGWGFGGLVTPRTVQAEEVAAVLADLLGLPALRTSLRPNPLTAAAWAAAAPRKVVTVPRVAHVLDLDGGFERVWSQRFKSWTRTTVRKAERSGLVVECDTTGKLVPVFYNLYLRSIDRWAREGSAPLAVARWRARRRDPLRKFQLVAEHLGEACRVWVAWLDGRPAAATIVLVQGANATYWRGAMDEELAGPSRANYLLHHHAIEDTCRAGCRYYHMGDTGMSTSLAQFKSRFGAEAHEYVEYRLERLPFTRLSARARGLARRPLGHLRPLVTAKVKATD